jgi:hypothetical protein
MWLFRSATATLDVSETIVHFGFFIYMMTRRNLTGGRVELTSKKSRDDPAVFNTVMNDVTCFLNKSVGKVRKMLSDMFQSQIMETSSIDLVSSSQWLAKDMVLMIANDAQEADVHFWNSYCQDHDGQYEILRHMVCFGCLPDLPGKDVYPTFEHFRAQRTPHAVRMILTKVLHADIMNQNSDIVTLRLLESD